MARRARIQSSTGIYHVTLKGINGQDIFEEERDYRKFLSILVRCQILDHFQVYAYCLMSNHVHLLVKTEEKSVGAIIHRIGTTYVGWFNHIYERRGHLFQDRFHSEAVENILYFRIAWRYILHNPLKAGLECFPGEKYQWSNVFAYKGFEDGITETAFVVSCFEESKAAMLKFLAESGENDGHKLKIMRGGHLPDETAIYILKQVCGRDSISDFQHLEKERQREYVRILHQKYKLPLKQICRITGMCYKSVAKYGRRVPVEVPEGVTPSEM